MTLEVNDFLKKLKRVNYGYGILVAFSFMFDLSFLTWIEALGGVFFFGAIFALVFIFPKGGNISLYLLYSLMILSSLSGLYIIYINLFVGNEGIDFIFRLLISILWILNISYYGYAIITLRKL